MTRFNYSAVENIVIYCTAGANDIYQTAIAEADGDLGYIYEAKGAQYAAIGVMSRFLADLVTKCGDISKDNDAIIETAADLMQQAANLQSLADGVEGTDDAYNAPDMDQTEFNRLLSVLGVVTDTTEPKQETEINTDEIIISFDSLNDAELKGAYELNDFHLSFINNGELSEHSRELWEEPDTALNVIVARAFLSLDDDYINSVQEFAEFCANRIADIEREEEGNEIADFEVLESGIYMTLWDESVNKVYNVRK